MDRLQHARHGLPSGHGGPGAGHVAHELRAPRRAWLRGARARLQGDARGGRGGVAGRLRRGGRPLGDLDLTPRLIEGARAERGDAPLAGLA